MKHTHKSAQQWLALPNPGFPPPFGAVDGNVAFDASISLVASFPRPGFFGSILGAVKVPIPPIDPAAIVCLTGINGVEMMDVSIGYLSGRRGQEELLQALSAMKKTMGHYGDALAFIRDSIKYDDIQVFFEDSSAKDGNRSIYCYEADFLERLKKVLKENPADGIDIDLVVQDPDGNDEPLLGERCVVRDGHLYVSFYDYNEEPPGDEILREAVVSLRKFVGALDLCVSRCNFIKAKVGELLGIPSERS